MHLLDTIRAIYAENLTCWLCQAPIIDHRYTPGCCSFEKRLHRLSVDHVLPRSLGGSDDIANLRPAHFSCNSARGNRVMPTKRKVEENNIEFFK
ncbi:HNH endonuclease [Rothia nasimurium]|uniref:HNH endonuclease n=1 Tax=Rothia nasimurium TaxID=85336 RepID=A0A4Y9F2M6_9MICC|nr:HNH endonuclease [Rothia nasimurium]TFU21913.1 HNH endonuclease [Rothia nasimurium]